MHISHIYMIESFRFLQAEVLKATLATDAVIGTTVRVVVNGWRFITSNQISNYLSYVLDILYLFFSEGLSYYIICIV